MGNRPHGRSLGRAGGAAVWLCALLGPVEAGAFQAASPGNPRGSLFDREPGSSSNEPLGALPGQQGLIGTGPGPGFPRVPSGITRPPRAFEPPSLDRPMPPPPKPIDSELGLYGPLSLSLGAPSPEDAPDAAPELTLDAAIQRLLAVNLDLRAQAFELSKADADILTAGLWANPVLFADAQLIPYGSFENTGGGPTQYDINITHPIDINGKWKRRVEVATRAKAVIGAQYQDAIRIEIDNLYEAWVDALAARETARFIRQSLPNIERLKQATAALIEEGSADPTDLNRLAILEDTSELRLIEAEETFNDANRTLIALLVLPLERAQGLRIRDQLRGLDVPPPDLERLTRLALRTRPDLAAFQLGIERARAEVRLARANRFEDVFVFYQPYTHQEPLESGERSSQSWALGVTVPLPIYDRNQGNIARAEKTVLQTRLQAQEIARQVVLEVRRAARAYEVTLRSIRKLEGELLPVARDNLDEHLQRFRAGEENQLTYLEAQRDFNELIRQYRDTLVRHRRAMLRVNTAVGRRIFP